MTAINRIEILTGDVINPGDAPHLDYISSQLALLTETEDHVEAAKAFLERRKPVFTGR